MNFRKNFPVALTFDIDWAPDFMIRKCTNFLEKNEIPATFFVTHNSKIISEIRDNELFELGIHPNFENNSTQGNNLIEVLSHLLKIVPEANSVRTHGLLQSSNIIENIIKIVQI